MTLSERLNKFIDGKIAKKQARKFAWQEVEDGHFMKQLVSEDGVPPIFIHVIGDKVYHFDSETQDAEYITGQEAKDYIASANATMAIRSTQASSSGGIAGFGKSVLSAAESMSTAIAQDQMQPHPRPPTQTNLPPDTQRQPLSPHPLEGLVSMPTGNGEKRKRPMTYDEWMGI